MQTIALLALTHTHLIAAITTDGIEITHTQTTDIAPHLGTENLLNLIQRKATQLHHQHNVQGIVLLLPDDVDPVKGIWHASSLVEARQIPIAQLLTTTLRLKVKIGTLSTSDANTPSSFPSIKKRDFDTLLRAAASFF